MELSFIDLFSKFAENYWNLVNHYHIRQMRSSKLERVSKLEQTLSYYAGLYDIKGTLEFSSLREQDRQQIIVRTAEQCKRYVLGALYADFDGTLYGFDMAESKIWINNIAYEFLLKYKIGIEQLNYYAWAKFLEKINSDDALIHVLDKLELATPRRKDLSLFRRILAEEFETNNCFYCGKKLQKSIHVDHVIPWSFIKEDNLWNFVLACPTCNSKKKDKLPTQSCLAKVITRNDEIAASDLEIVKIEFKSYRPDQMWKMWEYAKIGGMKVYGEN